MKQKTPVRWVSGTLVAGLTAIAMIGGTTPAIQQDTLPVKKSDFHLTEQITEGITALTPDDIMYDSLVGTSATGNPGSGNTVTAGSSSGKSNTVVAGGGTTQTGSAQNSGTTGGSKTVVAGGGGHSGVGPSILTSIVTEGEKGAQSEPILGGATLTMLQSQSNSQILSAILQTSQGKLIVIDGGLGADGDYLREQIIARGGHVAAWLITHPHGDHAGALYKILQDGAQGIQIDGIYYSFASPEWYAIHDPSEQTMAASIIGTFAGLPQNILHPVSRNQFIQVDDVVIQVMNDRYELSEDKGNNASIVYKMLVNGKTMLFLGDMGEAGGRRLLEQSGAEQLKVDIVQMAHHGQDGVGEEVYKAINPSICLWPTPQWLWVNEGNKWKIPDTKAWLSRLGEQKHYVTKDGNQVIR